MSEFIKNRRQSPYLPFTTLSDLARSVGLSVVGVTAGDPLDRDRDHLRSWQDEGYAGDMGYMQRDSQLLASPERLLPGVKSVVTVALAYDRAPRPELLVGYGRVARYAWGRDYHKVLRQRLERLVRAVEEHRGEQLAVRAFSDSVPLLERALAKRSGIAFIGKNTMAIVPGRGSFFLLGEILWELEVVGYEAAPVSAAHCGSCHSCMSMCPSQAFVSERVLDARRCISYLTIEKRGSFTLTERAWVGEWVFGCDVCQEVCPFNFVTLKKRERAALTEFNAESGVGPALDLGRVLQIRTHEGFVAQFGGTALMRAKREGLLRNAAVVAANTHAVDLLPELMTAAREDPAPIVRQHAVWAAVTLAAHTGEASVQQAKQLLIDVRSDPSEDVQREGSECERRCA